MMFAKSATVAVCGLGTGRTTVPRRDNSTRMHGPACNADVFLACVDNYPGYQAFTLQVAKASIGVRGTSPVDGREAIF